MSDVGNELTDERSGERNDEENQEGRTRRRPDDPGPGRRQSAAYQGAFEAVTAILIAGFAGKFADDYFGTSPRYLIAGFIIGFGSFVLRLVRLGRSQQAAAEENDSAEH